MAFISVRPAPAGLSPEMQEEYDHAIGAPRASGDEPNAAAYLSLNSTCAPRQRG